MYDSLLFTYTLEEVGELCECVSVYVSCVCMRVP